jgi:hypothetical protein
VFFNIERKKSNPITGLLNLDNFQTEEMELLAQIKWRKSEKGL